MKVILENKRLLPVLVALALLLPFVSGLYQPVQAAAADKTKLYGVDVSTYQGDIDWPMLAANNISFVIMRGGKRPTEDTEYYADNRFEQNYAGARSVGLKIGVYLYCGATTWESFEETVYAFLETIEGKEFDFPVYLDLEDDPQTELGREVMTQYALDALAIIREAGYEAGVYANLWWFTNFLDGEAIKEEGYALWLARYTHDCESYDYSDGYDMWQYSNQGVMAGHGGSAIDLDVSYVDFNFLPELYYTPDPAYEAYLPLKVHTVESEYYTPYYADLTTQISGASVFPTDECTIREIYTNGWCRFTYPTNAGEKLGYLPVSVFLSEELPGSEQMQAEFLTITYDRADLAEEIGYISRYDAYYVLDRKDDLIKALYPVSGGWKIGWYRIKEWTVEDAVLLEDYLLGRTSLAWRYWKMYDINDDGRTDVFDLVLVKRLALGMV